MHIYIYIYIYTQCITCCVAKSCSCIYNNVCCIWVNIDWMTKTWTYNFARLGSVCFGPLVGAGSVHFYLRRNTRRQKMAHTLSKNHSKDLILFDMAINLGITVVLVCHDHVRNSTSYHSQTRFGLVFKVVLYQNYCFTVLHHDILVDWWYCIISITYNPLVFWLFNLAMDNHLIGKFSKHIDDWTMISIAMLNDRRQTITQYFFPKLLNSENCNPPIIKHGFEHSPVSEVSHHNTSISEPWHP